jgi:hypothetical protein
MVATNYPALEGVWCIMDGLKIQIEKSGDDSTQNACYNGWLLDHFVGCVFIFAPSGIVVTCAVNAADSWHNSEIAVNGKLYEKLKAVYDSSSGITVVDSDFSQKYCWFMIQSGKCKPGETPMQTTFCPQATFL